jgi:hypothetical protein
MATPGAVAGELPGGVRHLAIKSQRDLLPSWEMVANFYESEQGLIWCRLEICGGFIESQQGLAPETLFSGRTCVVPVSVLDRVSDGPRPGLPIP